MKMNDPVQISRPQVTIYTDGACKGNPGRGGWGAWLSCDGNEKELFGGQLLTTNNRMELTAVIESLASLKRTCSVLVYTDSDYVRKGITEWIHNWKLRGWLTADRKPVKTPTCGSGSMPCGPCTMSNGVGSRGTPATPATKEPMRWPTVALRWRSDPTPPE